MQRRRATPTASLEERLAQFAARLRETAKSLPPGPARDELIRKAQQADTGLHICERLGSTEHSPPEQNVSVSSFEKA